MAFKGPDERAMDRGFKQNQEIRKVREKDELREHQTEIIKKGYERAVEVFEETGRIDPENFTYYDKTSIAQDLEYVAEKKRMFDAGDTAEGKEHARLAEILEAIIYEQAELSEWLGKNVSTIRASDFDNIRNGCDAIAEFEDERSVSHMALAIDVTYTRSDMEKKVNRIREEITSGDLTKIKYFKSPDGSYEGALLKVPRVIVAIDKTHVLGLADTWLKNKKKELANHPIQILILKEIALQLEKFIQHAQKVGRTELVPIFERRLKFITAARENKTKQALAEDPRTADYILEDRVFAELRYQVEKI